MRHKKFYLSGLVLMLLATFVQPASAHFLDSGFHFTYQSHEQCTKNAADVGHPPAGGAFEGKVESWSWLNSPWGQLDCQYRVEDPLAVRTVALKWNGSSWYQCYDSGYSYYTAHSLFISRGFTNPPCGAGWYTTYSEGYVWHNSQWVGGTLALWQFSSDWYHYLPA